jgi:hypothetical protein
MALKEVGGAFEVAIGRGRLSSGCALHVLLDVIEVFGGLEVIEDAT